MSIWGLFNPYAQPKEGVKPHIPTYAEVFGTYTQSRLEPSKPSEKVEQVESEILAWRGWALEGESSDDLTLRSFNGVGWDGPTLTADKVPEIGSQHGIYALKAKDGEYFTRAVYGQVALTGIVVEGECGYRAERATIRSLWMANPEHYGPIRERCCAWEIAGMLEQKYEVDVQVAKENWAKYAEQQQMQYQMMMMQQQYRGISSSLSANLSKPYGY